MSLINIKFHENPLKLLNTVDGQTSAAELMVTILQHCIENMHKCCKMAAFIIHERLNKHDDCIYITEPFLTITLFTCNIISDNIYAVWT
jgi:hypothetical protein